MKAFGFVSILVALAIVAVLARKQLSATHQVGSPAAAQAASNAGVNLPNMGSSQDVRRVQDQVQSDVNRMMQDRASQVEQGMSEFDKR